MSGSGIWWCASGAQDTIRPILVAIFFGRLDTEPLNGEVFGLSHKVHALREILAL